MAAGDQGADPLVGQTLRDCYRVIRKIGEGGMGAVYEAEHTRIGRRVAIKCLHPQHAQNADIVRRFHREAQAAARIGNEHIVEVTDMGELPDGSPFFVLELLTGQPLSDVVQRGPLPLGRAVRIVEQICDALDAAHAAGIVHRDLKPENVFLLRKPREPDFVKVLDFGISRFREASERVGGASTAAGSTLGTPYYMSPEQAHGLKDIDQRVDVWALGVMLYQMLTGRLPFEAETYPLLILKIVSEQPAPLAAHRHDVPPEVEAVVARAMAKPRDDRFASMRDVALALAPFRALDEAPAMRVPLAGAALGGAPSTPQLGGLGAMSGSGARPSYGVMPTPPPTTSQAPIAAASGSAARSALLVLVGGGALAALIGVGTFAVLSSRYSSRAERSRGSAAAAGASTDPVTPAAPATAATLAPPTPAAQPASAPATVRVRISVRPESARAWLDGQPIAALPYETRLPRSTAEHTLRVVASGYREDSFPFVADDDINLVFTMVTAAAPASAPPPADPEATARGAGGANRRAARSSAEASPPAPSPVPRTLPAPPPPRPPAAPAAAPRVPVVTPAPRPAPAPPARPVYVGPSRSDTTGLRPDPY